MKDNLITQFSVLDPSSKLFAKMRLSVIEIEKIILKELGFELYRIIDHPHKLMHHYLKLLKANNEVARKAWNFLNDTYRLALCVHYPSSTLAASCIYLSLRSLSIPMPSKPWWVLMETSLGQIHDICAEVLNLYSQPKICLKDIKDLIDDTCKSLNIKLNYSFAFDELFENEDPPKLPDENPIKTTLIPSKNSNIFGNNYFNKDVNSSSSTVLKKEAVACESRNSKSRLSKTKSKSPSNKKNEKKKNSKNKNKRKNQRSRSRSSSKSSSSSRSSSRHYRKNKELRNKKRKTRDSVEKEKKKRKRSVSNDSSKSKRNSK